MDHKIDYVFVDFINVMDPEFHNRDKVKELAARLDAIRSK